MKALSYKGIIYRLYRKTVFMVLEEIYSKTNDSVINVAKNSIPYNISSYEFVIGFINFLEFHGYKSVKLNDG